MTTEIRPELSEKNRYWIGKHRYYELKHFCLQYPEWRKAYSYYNDAIIFASNIGSEVSGGGISDNTAKYAMKRVMYGDRIKKIESAAMESDEFLYRYILKAVTEGLSFTYLKAKLDIPCGRDTYYDRYRRFFWILDKNRD